MPTHEGPSISVIEEFAGKNIVTKADKMKTPMTVLKEQLLKHDAFPKCQVDYKQCLLNPKACDKLRYGIQQLMD